jgi:hypothetical protein
MIDLDNQAARLFEDSTLVRAIERGARSIQTAAMDSRSLAFGRSWAAAGLAQPGLVIVAAALTHMVLTGLISRPVYWQWLILPSIALVSGAVLIAGSRRETQPDK